MYTIVSMLQVDHGQVDRIFRIVWCPTLRRNSWSKWRFFALSVGEPLIEHHRQPDRAAAARSEDGCRSIRGITSGLT